jgi:hypothetical protein
MLSRVHQRQAASLRQQVFFAWKELVRGLIALKSIAIKVRAWNVTSTA